MRQPAAVTFLNRASTSTGLCAASAMTSTRFSGALRSRTVQAVSADHQIVVCLRAIRKHCVNGLKIVVEARRGDAETNARACRLGTISQHFVKRGTGDADVGGIGGVQLRRRDLRDVHATRRENVDVVEAEPGSQVVLEDAEIRHGAHDVRLLNDAHAVDGPARVALDHLNVEAVPAKGNGRGQAADAAADDENVRATHAGHLMCAQYRTYVLFSHERDKQVKRAAAVLAPSSAGRCCTRSAR
jgi:hypothetical protein